MVDGLVGELVGGLSSSKRDGQRVRDWMQCDVFKQQQAVTRDC